MAGYDGYSMSNNAVEAYSNGEKPKSKWNKPDILAVLAEEYSPEFVNACRRVSVQKLKDTFLYRSSWHHTSSRYNRTDFYSVDISLSEVEALEKLKNNDQIKEDENVPEERWLVKYAIWEGSAKHRKCRWVEDAGVVKGDWFIGDSGTKKKVSGNYFELIRRLGEA